MIALLAGTAVTVPVAAFAIASSLRLGLSLDDEQRGRHTLRRTWRAGGLWSTVVLLALVLFGWWVWPLAAFLMARSVVAPAIAFARRESLTTAFSESAQLTQGNRIRSVVIAVLAITAALFIGPFIGTLVLILTGLSFTLVNLVSSVVNAVLFPWLALVVVMLYGDLTSRAAEQSPPPPPAE